MNKIKNKKYSFITKIFASIVMLSSVFLILFAYKYSPPISKTLTVDVQNIQWGTTNLQNYISINIYAQKIQIGSNNPKYRIIKIDANNFSLIDKFGNSVGKLDPIKTIVPIPPNFYTIGVDGQSFIGTLNFIDIDKNFNEGFLVFKDDTPRYLKIPIKLQLPVAY